MGLFKKRIDIRNPEKTTYSEDDLKKLDMNFREVFGAQKDKTILSPFRKEMPRAWQTRIREMTFEKILDDGFFSFKHLLVVPDPYGASVQTALLLFNTKESCRVRYTVLGKTPGTDFVWEANQPTTRHRVPVLGLYKGYTNKLVLELLDEQGEVFKRRDLKIYARDIALSMQNIITKVEHSVDSVFPFVLVNGLHFKPLVYDQNGEVRYSLYIRTNRIGMIPLQNGHFLYADASLNRVMGGAIPVACQYHEMDYMGRIYRSYLIDEPLGNLAAENDTSLFLLYSAQKGYVRDGIMELDRQTGRVVKRCVLSEIIGERYRNRKDWIILTGMYMIQGKLFLVSKRLHSVIALDWESQKVQWILAPKQLWEDHPLADKVLVSKDGQKMDSYMLSGLEICSEGNQRLSFALYCIQNKGTVSVPGAVSDDDSRVDFYEINEKEGSFQRVRSLPVVKSLRYGCLQVDQSSGRLLSSSGILRRRSDNLQACIEELDGQTGKMLNRFRLYKRFRGAWVFRPTLSDIQKPLVDLEQVILGDLALPSHFEGELPELSEEKLKKKFFANVRISDKILVFAMLPGSVDSIYLIGEKHAYQQDYRRLKKRLKKFPFGILLEGLEPDEYQMYVEQDGLAYHLKNEIRIRNKQEQKA